MNLPAFLDAILMDIRYGVRQLLLNPGFAAVAVLSLALGIGANTAIFQLVDAVRLRSLPVEDPGALVTIGLDGNAFVSGWVSTRNAKFTSSTWEELKKQQQAFSGMAATAPLRSPLPQACSVKRRTTSLLASDMIQHPFVPVSLGNHLKNQCKLWVRAPDNEWFDD